MRFERMLLAAVVLLAIFMGSSAIAFAEGKQEGLSMKPISSVEEGVGLVDSFKGKTEEFVLAVPDSLLDPVGLNMAIITDRILARGWRPVGFTQAKGYRIYRYEEPE
jgi:hypothetical protein